MASYTPRSSFVSRQLEVGAVLAGKHSGFSLIELMIVVAIIAVLSSVAFPAFQRFGCCRSTPTSGPCERVHSPNVIGFEPTGGNWYCFYTSQAERSYYLANGVSRSLGYVGLAAHSADWWFAFGVRGGASSQRVYVGNDLCTQPDW